MPDQPQDTTQDTIRPVSLRDTEPQMPVPLPQNGSRGSVVFAFAGGIMLTIVVMLILFGALYDNGDALTDEDVRGIVAEAIGTQNALQPPAMADDGSVDPAAIQQVVNDAVGTEVALLKPTNTPIPPTPTVIPVGVAEEDDAFLGPDDAPVVIVEFSDFQCGYCGRWYADTLPQILDAYPDEVKFVYRDFPIFGEDSVRAAMATECAEEQDTGAFWAMHNRLFDRLTTQEQTPLSEDALVTFAGDLDLDTAAFRECLSSQKYFDEVLADFRAAEAYGLRGTPGFVINGVVFPIGAQPFTEFKRIIDSELQRIEAQS